MDLEKYYLWSESLGQNKNVYIEYIEYISNADNPPKKQSSKEDYLQKIKQYLSQTKNPIESTSLSDIEEFLSSLNSDNHKNSNVYALVSFFAYIENLYPINFSSTEIKKFLIPQKEIEKKNPVEPLSFADIIKLRKILENEKKNRHRFIFELTYAYSMTLNEIQKCNSENLDYNTMTFKINENDFILNTDIQKIIKDDPTVLDNMSKSSDQNYFNEMGTLINRPLEYKDVKASNKLHSMKCPICQKPYLCESSNWCLLEPIENSDDKIRLACINCAETRVKK